MTAQVITGILDIGRQSQFPIGVAQHSALLEYLAELPKPLVMSTPHAERDPIGQIVRFWFELSELHLIAELDPPQRVDMEYMRFGVLLRDNPVDGKVEVLNIHLQPKPVTVRTLPRPSNQSSAGISDEQLEHWLTYHPPSPGQGELYRLIRQDALRLAKTITRCTPSSADQTYAIRMLRDAVAWANSAIANEGR